MSENLSLPCCPSSLPSQCNRLKRVVIVAVDIIPIPKVRSRLFSETKEKFLFILRLKLRREKENTELTFENISIMNKNRNISLYRKITISEALANDKIHFIDCSNNDKVFH